VAGVRRGLHADPRRPVRLPGEGELMRTVFYAYLVVIVAGLGFFFAVAARHA
jgi:hypothetical protein